MHVISEKKLRAFWQEWPEAETHRSGLGAV